MAANTLTAILPSIYAGLDIVSRELIGFIPVVTRNVAVERAAVGQVVTVPVVPAATTGNVTPAVTPPDDGGMTVGTMPLTISKSKYSPVIWTGEEQLSIGPTGQYNSILANQFGQAMRALANQIEVDIGATAVSASRAAGTAGTTPFGTAGVLTDFATVNRILDDNGAPMGTRHMVVGGAARQNLEGIQSVLFKVNEAGTDDFLRRRFVNYVMGLDLGFTQAVPTHVAGTGTGYVVNNGPGYPIGATSIVLGTGSGTVVAGDVVTFAGDSHKYIVGTGIAAPGTIVLNSPGLMATLANAVAMTIGASYVANLAFTENALILAARAPALPEGGDMAIDRTTVIDPVSGIAFEVSMYAEYRRMRYEVALAWGVGVVKEEHMAVLMG